MSELVIVVGVVVVLVMTLVGLWSILCAPEPIAQDQADLLAETFALRTELKEMAHQTRVEMIRVVRESAQVPAVRRDRR